MAGIKSMLANKMDRHQVIADAFTSARDDAKKVLQDEVALQAAVLKVCEGRPVGDGGTHTGGDKGPIYLRIGSATSTCVRPCSLSSHSYDAHTQVRHGYFPPPHPSDRHGGKSRGAG